MVVSADQVTDNGEKLFTLMGENGPVFFAGKESDGEFLLQRRDGMAYAALGVAQHVCCGGNTAGFRHFKKNFIMIGRGFHGTPFNTKSNLKII